MKRLAQKVILWGVLVNMLLYSNGNCQVIENYALFFAVSEYSDATLNTLDNSIKDAKKIAKVLKENYEFKTEIVENPTLEEIEEKLDFYRKKFEEKEFNPSGQLIIYFSGHGIKFHKNGYFLPKDGNPKRPFNTSIPYSIWRPYISSFNAQHILVLVDACFSVTFDPNWETKKSPNFHRQGELDELEKILLNHQKHKSRIFFTSDAKEDVVPGSSNFARKLLEGLLHYRKKSDFVTSYELYGSYVSKASPPPLASNFEGDDAESSFLFFPKKSKLKEGFDGVKAELREADLIAWKEAKRVEFCSGISNLFKTIPEWNFW